MGRKWLEMLHKIAQYVLTYSEKEGKGMRLERPENEKSESKRSENEEKCYKQRNWKNREIWN